MFRVSAVRTSVSCCTFSARAFVVQVGVVRLSKLTSAMADAWEDVKEEHSELPDHGVRDASWCDEECPWEDMQVEVEAEEEGDSWEPAWKQEQEDHHGGDNGAGTWADGEWGNGGWSGSKWGGSHVQWWGKKEEHGGYHGQDRSSSSGSTSKKGSYVKGGWVSPDGRFFPKLG